MPRIMWFPALTIRLAAANHGCTTRGADSTMSDQGSLLLQWSTQSIDLHGGNIAVDRKGEMALASLDTSKKVLPVGWFGAFSEGESTFTSDAQDSQEDFPDSELHREMVFEPGFRMDYRTPDALSPSWFHESPSGGPNQVWQTHYPSLEDVANRGETPPWRKTVRGKWQQQYQPPGSQITQAKAASWFDESVDQYDAYGRVREPRLRSGRRYLEAHEMVVNGALKCADPGCTASTLVRVHGPGGNARCSLSLWLHPTDFDDDHSKEELEWVKVNGAIVHAHCDPMAKSCGNGSIPATTRYQCMDHVHISHLLRHSDGLIAIEAKISKMVDECPIEGALLNAGIQLDCMVEDPPPTVPPPPTPKPPGCEDTVPLRCDTPGCTASTAVRLDPAKFPNGTCTLSVSFFQTDFDADHGSEEQVDAIWADHDLVMVSCKPGGNPCKQANVTEWIACIGAYDVTKQAKDGLVIVTAKISGKVDECGHNGFLLDAQVTVQCKPCIDALTLSPGAGHGIPVGGQIIPWAGLPGPGDWPAGGQLPVVGGWPVGILGSGAWPPGGRPPSGDPNALNESSPAAPEVPTNEDPWTCKCRTKNFNGTLTRECRKNGYLVSECTDPLPVLPPGAPEPTWPPGWNEPTRRNGSNGFERNETLDTLGYTCACRNGTKVINGTRTTTRQCVKNGCLVDNCTQSVNYRNCTLVNWWNQCECRVVPKNGIMTKECRQKGKVVPECPPSPNVTVENGDLGNTSSVTQTPTMFMQEVLPIENHHFQGRTESPSFQFEQWGDWE
jgi:hypothetical protein